MTSAVRGADGIAAAGSGKGKPLSALRVGVPGEFFGEGLDPEVAAAVKGCLRAMEGEGARVRAVTIPSLRFTIATYYIIATAEASSNLARYDGVRYGLRDREAGTLAAMYDHTRQAGFGEEVKRRIMLGTYVLSAGYHDAYYLKAMQARAVIRRELETAFRDCDVLVAPTTPTTAFRLGEKLDDPLAMYLADIFTVTANLAGLPAVSIPCGFSRAGLPIGCQIMGRHFEESTILSAAAALEAALGAMDHAPSLAVDET
jgi:aspartyl-tRNA(Asn)/glutamyl-tRNA(Gln) amidotransferase subunit A